MNEEPDHPPDEAALPNTEPEPVAASEIDFLHPVGQSTIHQDIAVPVSAQASWLSEIAKGECVQVAIKFGEDRSVTASLRRINNARGHLQFRYETRMQAELRDYLKHIYEKSGTLQNALLRIREISPTTFLFEPVADGAKTLASLSICRPQFHNIKEALPVNACIDP